MNKQKGFTKVLIAVYISIVAVLAIGYVKDIVKLVHCDFKAPYKAEVVYGIGALTGLGTILGYVHIQD